MSAQTMAMNAPFSALPCYARKRATDEETVVTTTGGQAKFNPNPWIPAVVYVSINGAGLYIWTGKHLALREHDDAYEIKWSE